MRLSAERVRAERLLSLRNFETKQAGGRTWVEPSTRVVNGKTVKVEGFWRNADGSRASGPPPKAGGAGGGANDERAAKQFAQAAAAAFKTKVTEMDRAHRAEYVKNKATMSKADLKKWEAEATAAHKAKLQKFAQIASQKVNAAMKAKGMPGRASFEVRQMNGQSINTAYAGYVRAGK